MSRYNDLAKRLKETLQKKREASIPGDRYGLVPDRGKEKEWDDLERQAEDIRTELRRIRYGQ